MTMMLMMLMLLDRHLHSEVGDNTHTLTFQIPEATKTKRL